MDGQNFENGQSTENQVQSETSYNNYQNNVETTSYQGVPVVEDAGSGKANGMQIASLVVGIFSILICCCYGVPSIIAGIVGIILAIMGNKQGKNGVGTAGLVCSIIGLVLGTVFLILMVLGVAAGSMDSMLNEYY